MRLLYVEDNQRLAQNTAASLKDNGFAVDWVDCGEDAVHSAKSYDYDAIILDLGLPDVDGLSVLKAVKSVKSEVPFIICTARDALEDRVRGLDAGSDDYLVKPFDAAELLARILSKDAIENALYGFDAPPTPNAIEVATHRLRKKLEDMQASATIHTLRGIGYFLDDDGR